MTWVTQAANIQTLLIRTTLPLIVIVVRHRFAQPGVWLGAKSLGVFPILVAERTA